MSAVRKALHACPGAGLEHRTRIATHPGVAAYYAERGGAMAR